MAVTTKKASALSRSKVPKRAVVKMKAKPDGRAEAVIAPGALIPLPALSEKKVDAVVGQRNRRTIRILSCGAKGGPGKTFFAKIWLGPQRLQAIAWLLSTLTPSAPCRTGSSAA